MLKEQIIQALYHVWTRVASPLRALSYVQSTAKAPGQVGTVSTRQGEVDQGVKGGKAGLGERAESLG